MPSLRSPNASDRTEGWEARTRTVSGLVPVPPGPPGMAIATPAVPMAIEELRRELARTQTEPEALAPLKARLAQLEEENARLVREVQAARVRPAPPPLPPRVDPGPAREVASLRERLASKDLEAVALRSELEVATHAIATKDEALTAERARTAAAESERQKLASVRAQLVALQKTATELGTARDRALERADEAGRSSTEAVAELQAIRSKLDAEKRQRFAAGELLTRETARAESQRNALEAQHAVALGAVVAEHAETKARAKQLLHEEVERARSEGAENFA